MGGRRERERVKWSYFELLMGSGLEMDMHWCLEIVEGILYDLYPLDNMKVRKMALLFL